MIDLHTHILPDLDDGAASWEDSLEMAQLAVDSGTKILAATCHSNLPGQHAPDFPERYRKKLGQFRELLAEHEIPLQVAEGMEIFADRTIVRKLDTGRLLTLNKSRYVLVEFALDSPAAEIYVTLDRLLEGRYRPVLAHPERYRCVHTAAVHVWEWFRMGAAIQINKGSVLGRFGRRSMETADLLLRRRLVALAASDAHSPVRRTTSMGELYDYLASHYGVACPELLLETNPSRILRGKELILEEPLGF